MIRSTIFDGHFRLALLAALAAFAGVTVLPLDAHAESCASLRNKYSQTAAKSEQYNSMGNVALAKRFLDQAKYYQSEMKRSGCN
jgi:hypothetical protein